MKPPTKRTYGVFCALALLCVLIAGLWPFLPQANDAAWLEGRKGIRFGGHGIAYTAAPQAKRGWASQPCAIEVWLRPAKNGIGTMVAFWNPLDPTDFSLFQEFSRLGLRLHDQRRLEGPHYYSSVEGVLHTGKPVLIAVTSDGTSALVYANGALVKEIAHFPLVYANLQAQLFAGSTPTGYGWGWSGEILGLATYARTLAPEEIALHYRERAASGREPAAASPMAALYVPPRYVAVHKLLLGFSPFRRSDWRDILVNLAGFIPLGFLLYGYLTFPRTSARLAVATIAICAAISLGIEVWQSYLPGRTSDWRDVILNTAGAAIGVLAYHMYQR